MPLKKEEKAYKAFIISVGLAIALSLSAIFLGIAIRTRILIYDELLSHARAHVKTITMARLWVSRYGGVYVEKKGGIESNPYLKNPDFEAKDGRTFTLRNPAMMTREISEFSRIYDDFSFHLTSLKLINPANKADEFEIRALGQFEKGDREFYSVETIKDKVHFRYMAPLYITEDCMRCHAHQGYKNGDVRGGISVSFNIEDIHRKLHTNTALILLFAILTTTLLLALVWYFTQRLIRRVAAVRQQIEEMAIKDMLTGISNRRFLIERFEEEYEKAVRLGRPLCCILLDIDHFKIVNDTYGHQKGDEVLKEVSRKINGALRKYDIFGRYGGEEFMVVSPETDLDGAVRLAERIREEIKTRPVSGIDITVSLGLTCLKDGDASVDDMIKRADDNLYKAKQSGRDCVQRCMRD